jgi:hypothetical protein
MGFKVWMIINAALAGVPLWTSFVYFRASPAATPLVHRIAVSLHGAYIAVLHLAAVAIGALRWERPEYGGPFLLLSLAATIPIAYSLFAFRGDTYIHLLQCVNLFWVLALLFIGGMMVTGQWL